jgi:hypothetical protein
MPTKKQLDTLCGYGLDPDNNWSHFYAVRIKESACVVFRCVDRHKGETYYTNNSGPYRSWAIRKKLYIPLAHYDDLSHSLLHSALGLFLGWGLESDSVGKHRLK